MTGTNPRTLTTSTTTNRLSSGTYDYRGNLTSYAPDTLTFDDLNRQVENVSTAGDDWQYLYDGGNERTVRTTTASGGLTVPRREIARYIVQAKGWSTTTACNEGSRQFADVHCADTDWKFIQAFFEHGVDSGCNLKLYCPENNVTRDTLAVILLKAEHGSGYVPPHCTGIFTDVPCAPTPGPFVNWIEQVYREGIVSACALPPALAYCPTGTVTETNMLTYLSNSLLVPTYHPIAGGSTYTFRDLQNRVVTEFYGPFAARDNIFLGNVLVASYVDKQPGITGNWQFHVSDHLGTLRLSVKGLDGAQVESHKYWPYGDDVSPSPPAQRLSFAAMERDTEANHYYDHARTHDFNLGRFLSPDKLGGRPRDPQSWNRYAYSRNNPLKYVDPNGLWTEKAGEFVGSVVKLAKHTMSRIKYGLTRKEAVRLQREGEDIVYKSGREAYRAAREIGPGTPEFNEAHEAAGFKAKPHFHPTDAQGKRIEGAGHGFFSFVGGLLTPLGIHLFKEAVEQATDAAGKYVEEPGKQGAAGLLNRRFEEEQEIEEDKKNDSAKDQVPQGPCGPMEPFKDCFAGQPGPSSADWLGGSPTNPFPW